MKEISVKKEESRMGFNIFGFISNYIRTMMNYNDVLKHKLDKAVPVFRNQFLLELLTRKLSDPANTIDRLEEFGIEFETDIFCIATVQILNLNETPQKNISLSVLKFSMEELIHTTFDGSGFHVLVINIDDKRIALLINEQNNAMETGKNLLYRNIRKFCDFTGSTANVILAVGISEKGTGLSALPALYNSSLKALQYRALDTGNEIIFIDEVKNMIPVFWTDFSADYEEKLYSYIVTGNEDEAVNTLRQILNPLSQDRKKTKSFFDNQMIQIAFILMRIAGQMSIDLNKELPHGNNLINSLGELATVQDGEALFMHILVFLCAKAKETRKDIEHYNLRRILRFIDDHIHEDLSMDTVSEHLNLSASHIYSIIRGNCNKSFVEYLTERKMEKACELLGQGMKVKEIAETLGYSSSKYFIYVFKRNKGVPPNQYKCIMQHK